jgi:hypothetical protein
MQFYQNIKGITIPNRYLKHNKLWFVLDWSFAAFCLLAAIYIWANLGIGAASWWFIWAFLNVLIASYKSEVFNHKLFLSEKLIEMDLFLTVCKPGELFDRMTILMLKALYLRKKVPEHELDEAAHLQSIFMDKLTTENDRTLAMNLFNELYRTNEVQWELEDKVRSEKSWEAAVAARDNNTRRVNIKNRINKLFGYSEELKSYKE